MESESENFLLPPYYTLDNFIIRQKEPKGSFCVYAQGTEGKMSAEADRCPAQAGGKRLETKFLEKQNTPEALLASVRKNML